MHFLVTGGTGFIGSALTKRLTAHHNVIITGTDQETIPLCNTFLPRDGWKSLGNQKIDVCFHQAANNDTTCDDFQQLKKDNVDDPSEMFEFLYMKTGCRKFINASSCAVYGVKNQEFLETDELHPHNFYGESKLLFEKFCNDFSNRKNCHIVSLRYSNVYGLGEKHKGKRASMIYQIIQRIKQGMNPILFEYGQQKRDWVYVEDVVDANLLAMDIPSGIYNCGSGTAVSFNRIIGIINSHLPEDSRKFFPEFIQNPLKTYQDFTQTNISKLSAFGYEPIMELENGISVLLNF